MADILSLSSFLTITSSLQTSASIVFPIDAVAPPPVRSSRTIASATRTLVKHRRRTRRKSQTSGDDGDESGFFGGDYGGFGGGSGWNFGGDGGGGGGFNWNGGDDESSSSFPDDPAFDFVYEVVCWIVFSNCLHYAFKKVLRLVTEEREKVPMRISSVC